MEIGNSQIEIIKENCYAEGLRTQLLSKNHFQKFESRFSFRTFVESGYSPKNAQNYKLNCKIIICIVNSDCQINQKCPIKHGFNYSLFGYQ